MESTLWYFSQCGKYNLKFPHFVNCNVKLSTMQKERLETFHKTGRKKRGCSTMCKVSWIKVSIHNVERGKKANKTSTVKESKEKLKVSKIWKELCDIFHNVESTI